MRPQLPAVGGYEGVGEVHSLGSAVKGFFPGDLVIPCPPSFGTSFCLCHRLTSLYFNISHYITSLYPYILTVKFETVMAYICVFKESDRKHSAENMHDEKKYLYLKLNLLNF